MSIIKNNIKGIVANIDQDNIDTDTIIPSDFIKGVGSKKLGKHLFSYLRYDNEGKPNQNFILNQNKFSNANIILSKNNFGCGSSREHAVWALRDFGIEIIIALSFSDIFYQNCIRNFLLPIVIDQNDYSKLKERSQKEENIRVDLENARILGSDFTCSFYIKKEDLGAVIKKENEITKALKYQEEIKKFQENYKIQYPWTS